MKKRMMTLPQFPLFLRFSVRMRCFTVFFIVTFINSQTPFSYSDSTIFISGDSYLYVESPVDISAAMPLSGDYKLEKQFSKSKHKTFFKLNSFFKKRQTSKADQAYFTFPKSSQYATNSNNASLTAILGNPSPIKLNHKIPGSDFWILPKLIISKKKLLYPVINDFNLLKIITNHFSRPPPAAIKSTKFF